MGEGGRNIEEETGGAIPDAGALPRRKSFRIQPEEGRKLPLPEELVRKLGLTPGDELEIVSEGDRIEIRPNIHSLARVTVEPTSRCNLSCRTCIRNTWREPPGDMSREVFDKTISDLRAFPHLESVMFGGFGEPTAHPDILRMVAAAKDLGVRAEMTTNGTLLDKAMSAGLIESGLDRLWISFDGVSEELFSHIRRGADMPAIERNVRRFDRMAREAGRTVDIGIAFVVMKKNIDDLRHLDRLIEAVGARRVIVSNVLPYSSEMEKEMVCSLALSLETFSAAAGKTEISVPRLDVNNLTREAIFSLLRGYGNLTLMGNPVRTEIKSCRFIRERRVFVRWDGKVSPCMALLHAHKTYLYGNEREIEPYFTGDVAQASLEEIWNSKEYREFREKVDAFDFSPCHACGGCLHIDANKDDCFGSSFPACGGCLWAQGVIQCP